MDDEKPFEVMQDAPTPRFKRARDGFNRMDVVNAFQYAFDMIGGTTRLTLWANQNPDKFYPLYAKLMPSTAINIQADGNQLIIEHAFPAAPPQSTLVLENAPHENDQDQLRPTAVFHAVSHAPAAVGDPGGTSAGGQDGSGDQ